MPHAVVQAWEAFDADTGTDDAEEVRRYFIPDFSDWQDDERFTDAEGRLVAALATDAPAVDD